MRNRAVIFVLVLSITPVVVSGDQEETPPPQEPQNRCKILNCPVHGVEFQAFQIPIRYGLPAPGKQLSVGLLEQGCRYRLVRKSEFPHAAPRFTNGGCIVMDDSENVGLRCACPVCSSNEVSWQKAYLQRTDVTQYGPGHPATEYQNFESELYLRIQELRALDEIAIADCLQKEWDRQYGEERMIPIPALVLCAVFLVLCVVHVRWLFGVPSFEGVVPTQDGKPVFHPSRSATLVVAVALLAAAVVSVWHGAFPQVEPIWIPRLGVWVLAAVFALRAVGDFRYCGVFKRVRGTKFARNDSLFFSPLCVAIAALAVWLALWY